MAKVDMRQALDTMHRLSQSGRYEVRLAPAPGIRQAERASRMLEIRKQYEEKRALLRLDLLREFSVSGPEAELALEIAQREPNSLTVATVFSDLYPLFQPACSLRVLLRHLTNSDHGFDPGACHVCAEALWEADHA